MWRAGNPHVWFHEGTASGFVTRCGIEPNHRWQPAARLKLPVVHEGEAARATAKVCLCEPLRPVRPSNSTTLRIERKKFAVGFVDNPGAAARLLPTRTSTMVRRLPGAIACSYFSPG
jgi:hypothetical protein